MTTMRSSSSSSSSSRKSPLRSCGSRTVRDARACLLSSNVVNSSNINNAGQTTWMSVSSAAAHSNGSLIRGHSVERRFDKRTLKMSHGMAMAASDMNVSVVEGKDKEVVEGVSEACKAWANAVQRLSVDDVVELYDEQDGTLLGTVDTANDGVRSSPETIRTYFNGFLDKDGINAQFPEFNAEDVIVLSPTVAVYNGYYAFELKKGGTTNVANAKFTFLYRKNDKGQWKIIVHNSGFTPEGLVVQKKKRWYWPF